MANNYCKQFRFNSEQRAIRLSLLDLNDTDHHWAKLLSREIIAPNVESIVEGLYEKLVEYKEFTHILNKGYRLENLKRTQTLYLLSLGVDFDSCDYFEERLRVGVTHARVGVSPSLYECTYRILQQLFLDYIPSKIKSSAADCHSLIAFILKITTLDMSLAIETYHLSKVQRLESSLQTLRHIDNELRHKVATDSLTGAASHGQSHSVLQQALRIAQRNDTPLCISMVDLDWFKRINDSYGHLVGDEVLRDVVARIQSAVRDFDTVGRYGGEEFIIILENTPLDTAREIAERVRGRVDSSPIKADRLEINMTLSQGIAVIQKHDTVDSLIQRADSALYAAKAAGRNCVKVADVNEIIR